MTLVESKLDGSGVIHISMNNPQKLNALDDAMVTELTTAILDANNNPQVKVAVLSGNGKAFSAGGDVKSMHERTGMFGGDPSQIRHNYRYGIQRLPRVMSQVEVPFIAAVQGYAVGGGTDLAASCDIRLAADTAVFSERFIKLGIISGDGGCWLWPRIMGLQNFYMMALTGDWIKAEDALAMGMVVEVVPEDKLLEKAMEYAGRIAVNPPAAIRATKRLIREGASSSLEGGLDLAASIQAGLHFTQEHRDAVAKIVAQIEKRHQQKGK
ncbi:enoyl-CoA hydratase-related protein [Microbulbifer sp. DLAB2-AF]|uniref:enoyl-CoA hydratase-related protein n=1 Tax=Microbulbifer sp. DLAB2-AF TaxID=3243395 RepID=UPI00403A1CEE